ncbi:MAG: phospho-N-acetylmuramoyl-pentapeptide-transferase [Synergistaceae bacterium]|jgi:phospho-N-acetylmuramoyl-pentapeptide-transferase|nr:phospho-N-acetylmuramoyl-pentapeptide-transferase [Synergistaceae bacterium]
MSFKILCFALALFSAALYAQGMLIRLAARFGIGQAIKEYGPEAHFKKAGTPGMGGLVALALVPFLLAFSRAIGTAGLREMAYIWAYPVLAAIVGLSDDILKLRGRSGDGLKSLQKLFAQIAVTVPWAWLASSGGVYLMPTLVTSQPYGFALLLFLGVGILNAVNVTDGIDGLACGAMMLSLAAAILLSKDGAVRLSSAAGLALLAAFLWHNSNPAELFMGDVGAHLWGALLLTVCVQSHFVLFVFPLAFLFGVEIMTVAIQIFSIRRFGKKVFLMSPIHHHFELRGWREPKIVARFCLAHAAGMVALLIFLLAILGLYEGAMPDVIQ